MIRLIVIIGRRWADKKNGNTYHSVHIVVSTDDPIITTQKHIGMTYGGGEQYVSTAADCLAEMGHVTLKRFDNGSREQLWSYCADNNIALIRNVVDVGRRKDL